MRYCAYESRRFDDGDFRATEEHGWVHDVDPPHTVTGELLGTGGPGIPGPAHPGPAIPGTFKLDDPAGDDDGPTG
jgi:hypothetical protein